MKLRIGVIGAGVIGGGMVRRALAEGHEVGVFDLRAEVLEELAAVGARPASSSADLAAHCDTVVISLPRAEDVEKACFAAAGLLEGLRPGMVVIDSSTTPLSPPFGVLNPNNHPPFTPTKPPKVSDPFGPFPPVVTNPPVKPPVLPPFNPPLGPIGPVKPPVDPIQPPFNPPLGPIGPIKPPVHPPIDPGVPPVIDPNPPAEPPAQPPAQPPAPPADPGNNDPHCPPHCPPFPWPPIFSNCIPGWGGYGGGFGGPIVIQPYPINGGGNVVTVGTTPTIVTVPAPAADAAVQSIDLELLDLRFVDDGLAADQGPRYRVTIRNLGRTDIASPITVALLASAQLQPSADAQYATATLESLKAGTMQAVDVRLPMQVAKQAQAFGFLAAAVAMTDGSADANPTNNGSTYERAAVRDVDLRLDTVRVEGDKLILVGEGFGRSAGKLTLQIGQAQHAVTTAGWKATEVGFAMPAVDAQGVDRGLLQVVRTDGRTGQPLEVNFAR